jgi:hypothetical protein
MLQTSWFLPEPITVTQFASISVDGTLVSAKDVLAPVLGRSDLREMQKTIAKQ